MRSTFDGVYIAKSGVQAARTNLNVTGQNISNANTEGYTRQRVDQSSIPPTGLHMLYAATGAIVGEGVRTDGISQLRNPFLDKQYRTQDAQCGLTSTQLSALQDIEDALNETSTEGISAAYSDLIEQLEGLTSVGNSTAIESTVKEAAVVLATKFNTVANQLKTIRNQQYDYLSTYGVDKVNNLLQNIASLSDQIKNADIAGSPALELMDKRNQMIDELSQYISVKVVETPTPIGCGKSVDTLSIYLADSKGDIPSDPSAQICLVEGEKYGSLKMSDGSTAESASIDIVDKDNTKHEKSNDLFESGSIKGYLSLLNEKGEFDTPSAGVTNTFRGIGYYESMLDTLAKKLAEVLNADNSTNAAGDNKPLFTNSSGDATIANITAANIRVSPNWTSNYLTLAKNGDASGSNSNILTMISHLTSSQYTLSTPKGIDLFTGSMQEAVDNVALNLGQEINGVGAQDSANSTMLDNIDTRRQALSSVDINEEAINLVVYNQSLSASARFMTTVDECLNTIINGMGIVGRG